MKNFFLYLIYLFIFLLPWQTRWIIFDPQFNGQLGEYGRLSIYSFDVIFLFLSLLILLLKTKNKAQNLNLIFSNYFKILISKSKIKIIFFLVLASLIAINIFLAESSVLAFYWWLRIFMSMIVFKLINDLNLKEKITAVWFFIVSMSISSLLGIYQFLAQKAFASKWLGLAFHEASELGTSVVETATGLRFLRAYGTFSHPNVLAGFLLLAFLLLLWLQQKKAISKTKFFIFSTLFIGGLFFTFSRAAWFGFLIINIGYIIYYIYTQKSSGQNLIGQVEKNKIFFINWFILLILATIYWPLVATRLGLAQEKSRLEMVSIDERISGYQEALQIIRRNFWGVGLGNYTQSLQDLKPNQDIYYYQPVHNVFILLLAELGLIFISFLLIAFVYLFLNILNNKNKFLIIFYLILFSFLFCLDHFWWTSASGIIMMVLISGFLVLPQNSDCLR